MKNIKTFESWEPESFSLSNNIESALSVIKPPFIYHFTSDSWGDSILIMEKDGKAFGRIYWYNDDNTSVYLDHLSVDKKARREGIGKRLQEIREEVGIILGAKDSYLWVKKDSWMHNWYQRRGYEDFKDYDDSEENAIWMKKSLV